MVSITLSSLLAFLWLCIFFSLSYFFWKTNTMVRVFWFSLFYIFLFFIVFIFVHFSNDQSSHSFALFGINFQFSWLTNKIFFTLFYFLIFNFLVPNKGFFFLFPSSRFHTHQMGLSFIFIIIIILTCNC